ncbi:MAG: hypothetical protein K0Q93_3319 [Nocardioidaceae bacterium]|jgi:hypothetical protein|nr:hypothetical protein [Nocardioidaceae bacterium]
MTEPIPSYTFPDRSTLLARLAEADPNPHAIEGYYPIIAERIAGETLTHLGVVTALLLSIADYVDKSGLSGTMAIQLTMTAEVLIEAVIDEPSCREAAVARLQEIA